MTAMAHPLPEGVSDTFVRPCLECGITIHVVDGRERDHLHHVFEADESRAAYAWWQGYDAAKAQQGPSATAVHHTLLPVETAGDLYGRYPHEGDCTGTLCSACGCCTHCAEDGHCDGRPGCSAQSCGCGDAS